MPDTIEHQQPLAAGTRLQGFTSLEQEIRIDDVPVRGEFPIWLSGTFMRATPAKFETGDRSLGHWFDSIAKLNVDSGAFCEWQEPGCYPSEPIFVAEPGATAEDDGVTTCRSTSTGSTTARLAARGRIRMSGSTQVWGCNRHRSGP